MYLSNGRDGDVYISAKTEGKVGESISNQFVSSRSKHPTEQSHCSFELPQNQVTFDDLKGILLTTRCTPPGLLLLKLRKEHSSKAAEKSSTGTSSFTLSSARSTTTLRETKLPRILIADIYFQPRMHKDFFKMFLLTDLCIYLMSFHHSSHHSGFLFFPFLPQRNLSSQHALPSSCHVCVCVCV